MMLVSIVCAGLASACTDEPTGDATFAGASSAERNAAIELARGFYTANAMLATFAAQLDNAEFNCPTLEQRGDSIGYIGGCATEDGSVYAGEMWLTNVPSFADVFEPTFDADQPMKLVFDGFSMTRAGMVFSVDGQIDQSSPDPVGPYTTSTNIAGSLAGVEFSVGDELACNAFVEGGRECDYVAGSVASLGGVGTFTLSGKLITGDAIGGWLALGGLDRLRVDFDAAVDNCAPYTIDDSLTSDYCFEAPVVEEKDPVKVVVVGESWTETDTDKTLVLTAYIEGDATTVSVDLAAGDTRETHQMTYAGYDAQVESHLWRVTLRRDDNTSVLDGEQSVFYKVTAVHDSGFTSCDVDGQIGSPFAGECSRE